MFGFLFKKIFGSKNERYLRRLRPQVQRINALEPEMQQLDDADFAARIARYKEEVQEGGKSLDSLLPESSPWCERPRAACWACAITTCSSSAAKSVMAFTEVSSALKP